MPILDLEQARLTYALRKAAQAHQEAAAQLERTAIYLEAGTSDCVQAAVSSALCAAGAAAPALDLSGEALRSTRAAAKGESIEPVEVVLEAEEPLERDDTEQILQVVHRYPATHQH
jgi:hypothetical protein